MSPDSKKEKREAARKARVEAQRAKQRARKRRLILTWALVALVAVVVAAIGFKTLKGKRQSPLDLVGAGCSEIRTLPELVRQPHLQPTDPTPKYNSVPPTSGLHLPTTAPWGAVDQTIDEETLVHNLEHGGVIIHYKDISDSDIAKIQDYVASTSDGVISQPNDKIDNPIALASWTRLQTCSKVSIRVIKAFVKARCNHGPENLTLGC